MISYNKYTEKDKLLKDIFQTIREEYYKCDYKEDDKLNVVMHRIIDNFVSYISINDLRDYLDFFNFSDMKTIDSGMLPEEPHKDMNKYNRCLLYCLIEQEMFNQEIEGKLK